MPPAETFQIMAMAVCSLSAIYLVIMDRTMLHMPGATFTPCRIGAAIVAFLGLLNYYMWRY